MRVTKHPQLKCTPVLTFENVPERAFDLLLLPGKPIALPESPSDGTGDCGETLAYTACLWPAI